MYNTKYSKVTLRVTDEEKKLIENHSFVTGLSQADILRESLKLYFKDTAVFETVKERKEKLWIL
ncbi:MAG: hypothetical protein E6Z84_14895 [Clostridium sp.]|uniref:hypothetical protein n=1 Tax=Clostridium sp. TaxID=1506 RepID=UPI0029084430|nr:hypothetical protein [Clostridium sp.]MDU5742038.1 hypothetical protein [Clostridium sp.]MDU5786441.1 hypothetical protein [Clostridium sp.]